MNLAQLGVTERLIARRRERSRRRAELLKAVNVNSFNEVQAGIKSMQEHWDDLMAQRRFG